MPVNVGFSDLHGSLESSSNQIFVMFSTERKHGDQKDETYDFCWRLSNKVLIIPVRLTINLREPEDYYKRSRPGDIYTEPNDRTS